MEAEILTHGMCTHCGKRPATRLPLRLCAGCSDELFNLPVGGLERKEWFKAGVNPCL